VRLIRLNQKAPLFNAQGGEYGNALQAASAEGHGQIVQLLLEKGADVNTQGGSYGYANSLRGRPSASLLDRGFKREQGPQRRV
jgi:ankyrin repeat protein